MFFGKYLNKGSTSLLDLQFKSPNSETLLFYIFPCFSSVLFFLYKRIKADFLSFRTRVKEFVVLIFILAVNTSITDIQREQEAVRKIRQKVVKWDRQIKEVRSGRSSLGSVDSGLLELLPPDTTRYINNVQRIISYQQRVIRSQDPVKYQRLVERVGVIERSLLRSCPQR